MSRTYKIAVLPGDGIGPEVVDASVKVLGAIQEVDKDLNFELLYGAAGHNCIAKYGNNLPDETIALLRRSQACLKGPMTTPADPDSPVSVAVKIRRLFNLFANVRPCRSLPGVTSLKPHINLVLVRENTEGLYSGAEFEVSPGVGIAMRIITREASLRIAEFAFKLAARRRRHLAYVHKANILKITDGIFKSAILETAAKHPEVTLEELHIDAAVMHLIKRPESFDVIVTTNLFGDILSDEAAQITGGIGLAPGANLGESYGMFEPIHGSAPDIAGKCEANPIATMMATSMMLEYLGEKEASWKIERAVLEVLEEGKVRTRDIGGTAKTSDVGEAVASKIKKTF
ncbi:MAG: isocitrate/isopropylmalate dehydrogenase family protein [Candidatus Bathycorpusculaceae bacterium]